MQIHTRVGTWTLPMALIACTTMPSAAPRDLDGVLAAPHRTPAFVERDRVRHPKETLAFFEVAPDQTVVEVWPGRGWYLEILAPWLKGQGRYYAAGFVTSHENSPQYRQDLAAELRARLDASPQWYGEVIVTELGRPDFWTACPPDTADRVLTFRNVHNWMKAGYEAEMFTAFYKALKPGGLLGVVEHRAPPGTTLERMKDSGYVTEAYVVEVAERAGFRLVAKSEVNANPKDTADHPRGVWTLPPSLRLGETDRAKYLGIGESDRMTLKFIKPMLIAPSDPA